MKKTILAFIILIGVYVLLKNNIVRLPGQVMWSTNPDLFYKMFIPLLMSVGGIAALIKGKNNLFLLSTGTMIVDAINRLAVGVNHFYQYQIYEYIPQPEPVAGEVVHFINLWPSHILFLIEAALIIFLILNLKATREHPLSS